MKNSSVCNKYKHIAYFFFVASSCSSWMCFDVDIVTKLFIVLYNNNYNNINSEKKKEKQTLKWFHMGAEKCRTTETQT